jgi:hypothetical protein
LGRVLFYYALFVTVDYLAAALAFALERKENKWLLLGLFWQRFFYRQLMYYVAIKSTLATVRGALVGWGKLDRKATVKAPLQQAAPLEKVVMAPAASGGAQTTRLEAHDPASPQPTSPRSSDETVPCAP